VKRYFKGLYFKAECADQALALIPAVHMDGKNRSASIQIVTPAGALCAYYPGKQGYCLANRAEVTVGDSMFSARGIALDVRRDGIDARGVLNFGPLSPIRYDIMGPFSLVPFMQCRHSVISMTHAVNGRVWVNGENFTFENGAGYIEGDRGRSFPKTYAWTQCNFYDGAPCSLMLSIADIPLGPARFTGVIGVVWWRGEERRIATYLGAKTVKIGNGELVIRQGGLTLTARIIKQREHFLRAPAAGAMTRMIRESLHCTAQYKLEEREKTLFEFTTDRAAFEYEYDR